MAKLSKGSIRALEMLREGHDFAFKMKDNGFNVNGSHLGALVRNELATATDVQLVCECCGAKRKVKRYALTEKGKTFSQDGE